MAGSHPHVAVTLTHPQCIPVHIVGTSHLAASHAEICQQTIKDLQPTVVVVELDKERFDQVDARLSHLLHQDSSSLLPDSSPSIRSSSSSTSHSSSWLNPLQAWRSQFQDVRNEGGALLLGSIYGADLACASLAAAAVGADLVLADRPQQETQDRLQQLLQVLKYQASQHSTTLPPPAASAASTLFPADGSLLEQPLQLLDTAGSFLAGALLLAAQQLHRLGSNWWYSSCSSTPQWYGRYVHPVFYLAGSPHLQQQLQQQGVQGVPEAAAAAARLLAAASSSSKGGNSLSQGSSSTTTTTPSSNSSSSWGSSYLPEQMAADLEAIRFMTASKEAADWAKRAPAAAAAAAGGSLPTGDPDSPAPAAPPATHQQEQEQQQQQRWVVQQPDAAHFFDALPLDPARAAYQQVVMHERDLLLTDALWDVAESAASTSSVGDMQKSSSTSSSSSAAAAGRMPCIVAVVGANHVPGITAAWAQRLQQPHVPAAHGFAAHGPAVAHGSCGPQGNTYGVSPTGVNSWLPSAALSVELSLVAGGAYLLAKRWQGHGYTQQQQHQQRSAAVEAQLQSNRMSAHAHTRLRGMAVGDGYAASTSSSSSALSRFRALLLGQQLTAAPAGAAIHTAAGGPQLGGMKRPTAAPGPAAAASAAAARWGRRVGLLLLPVAAGCWPLLQEHRRMQEATAMLQQVGAVNDAMLRSGRMTDSTRGLIQMATQLMGAATPAAAAPHGEAAAP